MRTAAISFLLMSLIFVFRCDQAEEPFQEVFYPEITQKRIELRFPESNCFLVDMRYEVSTEWDIDSAIFIIRQGESMCIVEPWKSKYESEYLIHFSTEEWLDGDFYFSLDTFRIILELQSSEGHIFRDTSDVALDLSNCGNNEPLDVRFYDNVKLFNQTTDEAFYFDYINGTLLNNLNTTSEFVRFLTFYQDENSSEILDMKTAAEQYPEEPKFNQFSSHVKASDELTFSKIDQDLMDTSSIDYLYSNLRSLGLTIESVGQKLNISLSTNSIKDPEVGDVYLCYTFPYIIDYGCMIRIVDIQPDHIVIDVASSDFTPNPKPR